MSRFLKAEIVYFAILFAGTILLASGDPQYSEVALAIGIDLGATNSCMGIYQNGQVIIIPNDQGSRITPSYVALGDSGWLIGEDAKNQAFFNPDITVFNVKRLVDEVYADDSFEYDDEILPYQITVKGGKPYINFNFEGETREFAPEEIISMLLSKMRESAETFLEQEVKYAVITVPTYFNNSQRQVIKDASAIAGLEVLRLITKPVAAGIAYGVPQESRDEKNILVFDLGGSTLDVSLLIVEYGVFEEVARARDANLGGENFDKRLMDYFIDTYDEKHGKYLPINKVAFQKLKKEVEKAKHTLSSTESATVEIKSIADDPDFTETLSRAKFEDLNDDLFKKILSPIEQVLEEGEIEKSDIEEILLVGGSTRIPMVQTLIKDFFCEKEPNMGINPDEAAVHGAAIQARIIAGQNKEEDHLGCIFLDIVRLSLGIETVEGMMTVVIPRGTPIPNCKSHIFTTYQDQQTRVNIEIYEGERTMVKHNHELGQLGMNVLQGITQIEVLFEIDSTDILAVRALDQKTGNMNVLIINHYFEHLSIEEIEEMIWQAEQFADQDKYTRYDLESYAQCLQNIIHDNCGLTGIMGKNIYTDIHGFVPWLMVHPEDNNEENTVRLIDLEGTCHPLWWELYQ